MPVMMRGLLIALAVGVIVVVGILAWPVTVERYPDLKSNANFLALQTQLEGTENRITVERRRFNEAVRDYNTRLRLFPGSVVASLGGYQSKAFFEATPDAATAPKVKF